MIKLILFLIILFLYSSIAEYIVHRWFMHKPFGRSYWKDHAIEHHAKNRVDINISIGPIIVAIIAIPILLFSLLFGIFYFLLSSICCILYSITWTALHNCHHDLCYKWIRFIPFYNIWRTHHLNHHIRPSKNFGTIFIWTDWLFNTKY